jgi:FkbM family methyltransferase
MIIFDVGANNGSSCDHYINDKNTVYAFEPTPYLLNNFLYKKSCKNYIVIPKAVSDYNGVAEFNIAGQADWGCSSLNIFENNLNETWPNRTDFKITEKIQVEVIRLDSFIEQNKISHIDFLHCDTQGNDLKVLKSLGKYIDIVNSGSVEVFKKNPLYVNIDNSFDSVVQFLKTYKFNIKNIISNDSHGNEYNITFEK